MLLRKWVVGVLALFGTATNTFAQDAPFYFGAKVGVLNPEPPIFDSALNIGALAGYRLYAVENGSIALEGEFTTTLVDGNAPVGNWDADTMAVSLAVRAGGSVYLGVKVGYADVRATFGDDSGFVTGLDVGWRVERNAAIEFGYLKFDEFKFFSFGFRTTY